MFNIRAITSIIGKRNVGKRILYSSKKREIIDPDEHLFRPRRLPTYSENFIRVCIAGGAGSVGSKLALLLKTSPMIDAINMYDVDEHTYGVAVDLSHIDSKCKVYQYRNRDRLQEALAGASVVIICASGKRKCTRDCSDMFEVNAEIVEEIATATAMISPEAFVLVVTQPVDSLTPLVGQVYRDANLDSRKKVVGITSGNVMRATRVLAETLQCNPTDIIVPVIGGHSRKTIIPVFSACLPMAYNNSKDIEVCNTMLSVFKKKQHDRKMEKVVSDMTFLVQHWEAWVTGTNPEEHSATLTGAMSAYRTTINLVNAIRQKAYVVDTAFVETDVVPGLTYCSLPIKFGPEGVHECYNVPLTTKHERDMLSVAVGCLEPAATKGRQYAIKSLINRTLGLPFTP